MVLLNYYLAILLIEVAANLVGEHSASFVRHIIEHLRVNRIAVIYFKDNLISKL